MSNIEWTQQTWNPTIGCSKKSAGCENCYAERMAYRMSCNPKAPEGYQSVITDGKWNGKTGLVESALTIPLKRKKPTVYFVGSMTDLFHKSVKNYWLDEIFAVMGSCPQHRFILLTKRPERMQEYCSSRREEIRQNYVYRQSFQVLKAAEEKGVDLPLWPLPNVLLGVTAENQEQADKRIPILLDTPAAARFVSIEPMLGAVDLTPWDECDQCGVMRKDFDSYNEVGKAWDGWQCFNHYNPNGGCDGTFKGVLDWVICGGESGPNARPMHPDWVSSLRDQCSSAGTPFFFKQWGESVDDLNRQARANVKGAFWMLPNGTTGKVQPEPKGCVWMNRVGKHAAGNLLNGQTWEQYPQILREVNDG
ncbi:DUF5131 family protein [Maridesulfovibrio bastinii]|uniref:DUF5131 family protein n=1 Tax=Maridesulfovibrio bastinii TaxID=47157 RepID=UPI00041FD0EF|nr:phage Gp37/Gp68 family protein [Maridesulfovibrio bastinii]